MWFDSHCHLDDERYNGQDPSVLVDRAKEAGVDLLVTIGTSVESSGNAVEISERFDNVYCAVGVHPHESDSVDLDDVKTSLLGLAGKEKVVAVGEIGLDYYKNYSSKETQINLFHAQIEVAKEFGKPLVIHCRDAHEDCHRILMESGITDCVIHCFTGNKDDARKYVDLGYYISFSGIVTFQKAVELQKAAKYVPLDRILIETDAPYLAPEPYRGKINEPAYVVKVARKIAELKSCSLEELSKTLQGNIRSVFRSIP